MTVLGSFLLQAVLSTLVGFGFGFGTSLFTKHSKEFLGEGHSLEEMCTVVMLTYMSYITAEVINMSGIISLIVTGIILAQYCYYNLSDEA